MSSLAKCLEMHGFTDKNGKPLRGMAYEVEQINAAVAGYHADGVTGSKANVSAVTDIIKGLEKDRTGIIGQAEEVIKGKKAPKPAKVEPRAAEEAVVKADLTKKEGEKPTREEKLKANQELRELAKAAREKKQQGKVEKGVEGELSQKQISRMLDGFYNRNKDVFESKEEWYDSDPDSIAMSLENDYETYNEFMSSRPEIDLSAVIKDYQEGQVETKPEVKAKKKPVKATAKPKEPSKGATEKDKKRAVRFRTLADNLQKQIDDKRGPMTQNPTPKRMREYNSRIHDANNLERTQNALMAISDALEAGTLPTILEDIGNKAQIEPLVRKGTISGGYYDFIPSPDYSNTSPKAKALQGLIEKSLTGEQVADRKALDKRRDLERLEEKVRFSKIPGFFPTPKITAEKMVEMADIEPGMSVLEPSAGKGDIAEAVQNAHPEAEITTIERMQTLRELLEAKGFEVVGDDFLEHEGQYDRIIQNPPFEKKQDIDHVRHAYDQLKFGGRLVSIMSEGPFFGVDKKSKAFQEWFANVGGVDEKIGQAFKGVETFRQTGVSGRIIVIDKVGEAKPADKGKPETKLQAKAPEFKVKPPKKLYRGTSQGKGTGIYSMGKGIYSTPDKSFAKKYGGDIVELDPIDAFPRNPLVLRNVAGGAPGALTDWILQNSDFRNIREFNEAYPDPGAFVREKGYDGVVAGDEVVRYIEPDTVLSAKAPTLTPQELKNTQQAFKVVIRAMKDAGLSQDVINRLKLEFKPIIELRGKNLEKTLKEHALEGLVDIGRILEATTVMNNLTATIEFALEGTNITELDETAIHASWHIIKTMMPQADQALISEHFKTEEGEADGYVKFVKKERGFLKSLPEPVRKALYRLKVLFSKIRRALTEKGFKSAEDIFGKAMMGAYRGGFAMAGAIPSTQMQKQILSEEAKTANFKKWFKNSVVKDEKGEPLVVYHGSTSSEPFKVFEGMEIAGWFSEKPKIANIYSMTGEVDYDEDSTIYPVYLSIKKPLDLIGKMESDEFISVDEFSKRIGLDYSSKFPFSNAEEKRPAYEIFNSKHFSGFLKDNGYDGIKIDETVDGKTKGVTWGAIDPTQIKSIYNVGTWSPDTGDIRLQAESMKKDVLFKGQTLFQVAKEDDFDAYINDIIKRAKEQQKKDITDPPIEEIIKEAPKLFDTINKRFGKGYTDKDIKLFKRFYGLPYWLGKKYKSINQLVKKEIQAAEKRSIETFNDYNNTGLAEIQDSLPKNKADMNSFRELVWKADGKRFSKKAVPTNWHEKIEEGEDIKLNPKHYEEVEAYLKKQGYAPDVVDAFVTVRRLLDNKYIDIDKTLRIEKLDPNLIQEYRAAIGKIHNYFPHKREGDSYVQIINTKEEDPDKKTVYREHYSSLLDRAHGIEKKAPARARDWLRGGIKNGSLLGNADQYKIKIGKATQLPDEVFFQIPVESIQQVLSEAGSKLTQKRVAYEADRLFNKQGKTREEALKIAKSRLTADLEDALSKSVADVLKSRGWGRHSILRKGTPGHETEDVFGILFDYLSGYAGFKTKMERAKAHHKVLIDIDAKENPGEYKYASRYVKDVLSNSDRVDRVVDGLRAAFFVKYLGFVPKSGLVNLTQNVVMAAPMLSVYTSGSHRKLAKAMIDTRKALTSKAAWTGKEIPYKTLSKIEREALKDMIESGATQDLFLRELKGNLPGSGWPKHFKKVIDKSGVFMQVAEKFNRASTGLAAFRVAYYEGQDLDGKDTKGDYEASLEWAKDRVYDSHFLYGKANYPEIVRGGDIQKMFRAAYSFRTFTHNYLLAMNQLLRHQGAPGKKAFARSLRNLFLMGGLTSIPFFKAVSEVLLWASDDDEEDAYTKARRLAPYDWLKDLIVYGLPGAAGADLTGSLSIEIPRNWKDIMGVPYSIIEDTANTVKSLQSGAKFRALSETPFTPISVKNAMRGIELYTKGQRSRGGKEINYTGKVGARKITGVEAFMKSLLGLQPVSVSKGYGAYKATARLRSKIAEKKSKFVDRLVNAMGSNDRKEIDGIYREIADWNDKAQRAGKYYKMIDVRRSLEMRFRGNIKGIPRAMRGRALDISKEWGSK